MAHDGQLAVSKSQLAEGGAAWHERRENHHDAFAAERAAAKGENTNAPEAGHRASASTTALAGHNLHRLEIMDLASSGPTGVLPDRGGFEQAKRALLAGSSLDFQPPHLQLYERSNLDPIRDSRKSVSELINEGIFRDARSPAEKSAAKGNTGETGQDITRARESSAPGDKSGKPPEIIIQYQDHSKNHADDQKPDFIIKQDGTVEVHRNFEANSGGNIVVQVERQQGQVDPADAAKNPEFAKQTQAQADLLKYLSGRIQDSFPDAKTRGVILKDVQNLVPESVEKSLGANNASRIARDYSAETQHAVENLGRFSGAGHGRMSRKAADAYFPTRDVPYQKGETNSAAAFKDTVAAIFNADKDHPYETVRHTKEGGYAVGRYGLTKNHLSHWLAGLNLGDPPDPARIAQLIKEGKLPEGFNAESLDKLKNLAEKMASGTADIKPNELKTALPKELQETIATDLSKKYTGDSKGDPSTAALAWLQGKQVKELTKQDLDGPEGRQVIDAAQKAYSLATARQMSREGDQIHFQDGGEGSPLGIQIASRASRVAEAMGSVGYCKRGVRQALEPFGIHLQGAYAKDSAAQLANNSRVQEVSTSDLRPGDILVHQPAGYGRTIGQRYAGHIAVYLGNGREASDHVQHLIKGQGYGGTRAFRVMS